MKMMRIPALAFVLAICPASAAESVIGRASVVDGDTLDIKGTRIRLHGIDAPESAQLCQDSAGKPFRCGQTAALALANRIGFAPVSCNPRDTDKYGRTVAISGLNASTKDRAIVGSSAVARRLSSNAMAFVVSGASTSITRK